MQPEYILALTDDIYAKSYTVFKNVSLKAITFLNTKMQKHHIYEPARTLYTNGTLHVKSYYTNDKMHGTTTSHKSSGEISVIEHHVNGHLHNEHGPALIIYHNDFPVVFKTIHYKHDVPHNDHGPAVNVYTCAGKLSRTEFYQHGKLHNERGPAVTLYGENGKIIEVLYFINGEAINKKLFQKIYKKRA
jgi:antitoxin component YwqK of YwqJK toxin-antitoxin module